MEITNPSSQIRETQATQSETPKFHNETWQDNLPFKVTPLMKKLLILLGIVFILLILAILIPAPDQKPVNSKPTIPPTTAPQPSPITQMVSEFAKTEEFEHFENKLNDLRSKNDQIDFKEQKLTFPLLEMNVTYEKR